MSLKMRVELDQTIFLDGNTTHVDLYGHQILSHDMNAVQLLRWSVSNLEET